MSADHSREIERVILEMLKERGAGKTICPSEAARRMAGLAGTPTQWRTWMNRIRVTANLMTKRGMLVVLQGGERVDPATVRGPVRLALPTSSPPT